MSWFIVLFQANPGHMTLTLDWTYTILHHLDLLDSITPLPLYVLAKRPWHQLFNNKIYICFHAKLVHMPGTHFVTGWMGGPFPSVARGRLELATPRLLIWWSTNWVIEAPQLYLYTSPHVKNGGFADLFNYWISISESCLLYTNYVLATNNNR